MKKSGSTYNKNILKLLTGTTLAQAIPIAISPILTRLYTPEDFGVLALFIAITTVVGTIANLRYELAIVLPKKEENAVNLVALSILISSVISLLFMLLIIICYEDIIYLIGNDEIGNWLYTIPIAIFFIGIFNALNYYNTRLENFGLIAKVKVLKTLSLSIFQMLFGYLKFGFGGLIGGQLISHIFSNGKLALSLFKNKVLIQKINIKQMIKLAVRYKRFPLITMWASFANTLSQHSITFFLSLIYSTSLLGQYSLIQRILGLPTSLIGRSIGQVFLQKATSEKNIRGNAKKIYVSTLMKLLVISLPIFTIMFFVIEDLIRFVFGEEWGIAGVYAKYLLPLFFLRFLATPLSLINIIFERQKIDLIWQSSLLISTVLIFIFCWLYKLNIYTFFTVYSVIISFNYFIILIVTYQVSKNKTKK
ncbi:lipopolysaccharide biosynthesis protein [Sutcliffiella rhizosphaerae]|uniref:O-antigen/teichoic acid export membrane protein n=1 Tax=Sutcliffiella rhizosphaerae TaxID=2880967 RepID=A0ABM8YJU2_9BACI|nr:lipopolysaccharide biosynthesis protein [Sutcliffiella rhizosphaerae]CAG9620201.1 hypothetical protein BACCIP111883_00969 [Sutcliffiella rhizosphaerae]